MKTSQSFINEYRDFDDVFDCITECQKDVTVALYNFNQNTRNVMMKGFFEGVDVDTVMEKETEGFLSKIGSAVLNLIAKVADFLRKIGDKILGNTKLIKTDEEKVSQILAKHPELKKDVCKGLKEEWFTYKDVAAFEKDIAGLINMLERNAIDHETFKDKVTKAINKFNESAKPVITAGATVANLVSIVPTVHKSCADAKKSVSAMSDMLDKFKNDVDKNYGDHDQNKATSIFNALSQAVGLTTKECTDRVVGQKGLSGMLNKLCNSKVGEALHLDDTHRDARHQKTKDKLDDAATKKLNEESIKEQNERNKKREQITRDVEDEKFRQDERKRLGVKGGSKK